LIASITHPAAIQITRTVAAKSSATTLSERNVNIELILIELYVASIREVNVAKYNFVIWGTAFVLFAAVGVRGAPSILIEAVLCSVLAQPPNSDWMQRLRTGTGGACAPLSEILPAARVAHFVRMTQKTEGNRRDKILNGYAKLS
jgi:hypothetical protein